MTGHKREEELRPETEPRDEEGSLAGFPERDRGVVQDGPGNANVGTTEDFEVPNPSGIDAEANIRDDERAEDNVLDNAENENN